MKGHGRSVEVELRGQKISLKTSGDPEMTREVLDLVAKKIKKIEEKNLILPAHQVALLALLDLGEDYVLAKKRFATHRAKVESSSQELFKILETEMR